MFRNKIFETSKINLTYYYYYYYYYYYGMETSLWNASEECVQNDFFSHSLDDSHTSNLIQVPSPKLEIFNKI